MSEKQPPGPPHYINGLLFFVFWIVVFALLVFLFYRWHAINAGGIQKVVVNNTEKKVLIRMDSANYYRANGTINGVDVNFIVDTGANSVAVPKWLALKAGMKPLQHMSVQTAPGIAPGHMARIEKLTVCPITLYNVRALIMADESKYALLGMSALKQLKFRQQGDFLILTQSKKAD